MGEKEVGVSSKLGKLTSDYMRVFDGLPFTPGDYFPEGSFPGFSRKTTDTVELPQSNGYNAHILQNVRKFSCRELSSATAFITRPHRNNYLLTYHTKMVLADGSSVTCRYHEPRQIITLPLDISTLSEEEAKLRLERRKPRTKVKIQEEEVSGFDASRYIKLIKNKKTK